MRHGKDLGGIALILLVALLPRVCAADVFLMKNGDRLTGDVIRMEGSKIRLRTPYAGTIDIALEQVERMDLDDPEIVLLKDEETVEATAMVMEGEEMVRIETADGSPAVRVATGDIYKVVPPDWELGKGGEFSGRANLAFKSETGNSESDELDIDYSLTYRRKADRFRSKGILELDSDEGTQDKQEWTVNGKYDRFLDEKLYFTAFVEFKQEKFADLDLRTTVGPGLGYQFIESSKENLLGELALLYVQEKFSSQSDDNYIGPGWHFEYDRWLWEEKIQFYHNHFGNVRADDPDKFIWRAFTGLRLPLGGGFIGSGELEVDYDGQPASAAETTDTTFRLKLGYEW